MFLINPQPWRFLGALGVLAVQFVSPCAAKPPTGETRIEITRDTWVSAYGEERDGNNGGSDRLKAKGIQEFAILDVDPAPLRGRVIKSATLHVLCQSPKEPLRRVTVSTLASPWFEGTSSRYRMQAGSSSFNWSAQGTTPWTYPPGTPNSDITAVINGAGNTFWRFADASVPDREGWQSIAVDPRVLAARVAGVSHGLVVFDDVGSEYKRSGEHFTYLLFLNRYFASREAGPARAPYITVELGPQDAQAPDAIAGLIVDKAQLARSQIALQWRTPIDHGQAGVVGFNVRLSQRLPFDWDHATPAPRYLIPLAGGPGDRVDMPVRDLALKPGPVTVGVQAIDAAGNLGPIETLRFDLPRPPPAVALAPAPALTFSKPAPLPRLAATQVAIVDALDKLNPVTGQMIPARSQAYLQANHLWSAGHRQVRLHAGRNEFVDFQVLLMGEGADIHLALSFDDQRIKTKLLRFRHVVTPAGLLPDPLVPFANPLRIPSPDDMMPRQRHASLIAEVYVPHELPPGDHRGTLTLTQDDRKIVIDIALHVWNFTLPDYLSFLPEMNSYGLPTRSAQEERAYYRLAHEHRTVLNRLAYNWQGKVNEGFIPRSDGRQYFWDAYDERFGPLFDGSAFADMPRKGVPVEVFYLPINENWPASIERGFTGGYWADEALTPEYREQFMAGARAFAEHIQKRGWTDTLFEFYLNNKVYHKKDRWSGSSAPWIFDEPVNTQDFWALRWYATAFHEAVGPVLSPQGSSLKPHASLVFRADISRPQWQRDLLDGLLDVNIVGGDFRQYHRMVLERRERNGELVINYGSSNPIEQSNVQPAGWCVEAWCLGADGVLPWQTIGTEESWRKGDALALFYPALRTGPAGPANGGGGPVASVRLKSYRRGQQDVEYLTMLTRVLHRPREDVAAAVSRVINVNAKVRQVNAEDAGTVELGSLDAVQLWALRLRVGAMLDAARPPFERRIVDLRPPLREVEMLPTAGHVGR